MEYGLIMRHLSIAPRRKGTAFSLMELLVVMVILVVLATLGTVAFSSIYRSSQLSAASRLLQSEVSLARQHAITFHRETEVRFFQTERPGGGREWSAVQVFISDSTGGMKALRKPSLLPEGVMMDENLSSLLESAPLSGNADFGRHGSQAYRAFRFRPGGNTQPELTAANNTLVLRGTTSEAVASLPDNFIALVVTPLNGKTLTYQP